MARNGRNHESGHPVLACTTQVPIPPHPHLSPMPLHPFSMIPPPHYIRISEISSPSSFSLTNRPHSKVHYSSTHAHTTTASFCLFVQVSRPSTDIGVIGPLHSLTVEVSRIDRRIFSDGGFYLQPCWFKPMLQNISFFKYTIYYWRLLLYSGLYPSTAIFTFFSPDGITLSSFPPFKLGSSFMALSMMFNAFWICSSVITSGGARRMIFW